MLNRLPNTLILGITFVLLATKFASAETWPQFRGTTGSGVSSESNLPTEWSESNNVLWKTELPGFANSSPAVTEKYVVLTTQAKDDSL